MTQYKKSSNTIISLVAGILTYPLFFLISCTDDTQTKNINKEKAYINPIFNKEVITEKPVLTSIVKELTLTGKVECNPEKVIRYIPLVRGVVEHTYFSFGDKVHKGQILIDIKSTELSAMFAETIALESELEVMKRNMQNAQSMYDDKILSDKELLEAKAKLNQVQASFERAKNDISLYKHNGNGVFSILAPMNGYIVDKRVASGSTISSEVNPLFTIADLDNVWITANVYAGDLQLVQENTPAEITTLSYPGEVFTGKINALSHVFDPEEKVLKARIIMPNKNLKFKPEMSVIVRLKNQKAENRIAIPTNALIFDDNKYFVVVEEIPGKFKIKLVELSGSYAQSSYISLGLDGNENIVVKNQLLIYSELNEK